MTPGGPPADTPTVSTAVAHVVSERAGHLFGLLGNGNAHVVSHLTTAGFPFTSARHEVATVTMADSYHRATGRIAAATTTYGPGFTNTYTGLAEAALARVPMVLVTGDAPTEGLRDFDIDQPAAAAAVGVPTFTVTAANPRGLTHHAFDTALRERRPVVLAIPYDLATAPVSAAAPVEGTAPADDILAQRTVPSETPPPEPGALDHIAGALRTARRPLILAGRGTVLTGTGPDVRELGDRLGAMFMTSVMATNVIDSPWNLGIAGGFSRIHRLEVAQQADVVLVLGASLNPFQTRYGTLFADGARVIRVDEESPGAHPKVTDAVQADLRGVVAGLLDRVSAVDSADTWRARAPHVASAEFRSAQIQPAEVTPAERAAERPAGAERAEGRFAHGALGESESAHSALGEGASAHDAAAESAPAPHAPAAGAPEFCSDGRLNPRAVAATLDDILPAARSVVTDGGNFIGWAPMYFSAPDPHGMVLLGTKFQSIGLGFGSAAGVAAARPDRTTVLVTGDGGALMGLADMETFLRAARRGVVVVFNDAAYGAELHQYAAKGLHDAAMRIQEVDFAALGRAFGADGVKARTLADFSALTNWLARHDEGVFILDVAISDQVMADFMTASIQAKSAAAQSPDTRG